MLSSRHSSIKSMRKAMENPLLAGKSRPRMIHIELAYIVQCRLLVEQALSHPFTDMHAALYSDLLKLATSRYDTVSLNLSMTPPAMLPVFGLSLSSSVSACLVGRFICSQ